jgi:hypothetical protein
MRPVETEPLLPSTSPASAFSSKPTPSAGAPPGRWQVGATACLEGMRTAELNGLTVTLAEWKAAAGRWKVVAEGERFMDVLPEKLRPVKTRRPSLADRVRNLFPAAHVKPEVAGEGDGQAANDALRNQELAVFTKAWVRRKSIDAELTVEEIERERAEIVPELARVREEHYMQSEDFLQRLEMAERRDEQSMEQSERTARGSGRGAIEYA